MSSGGWLSSSSPLSECRTSATLSRRDPQINCGFGEMGTVDDGVRRWDLKSLNHRFNRVSFDFCEPRNTKRSETIAKRSKTPLRKSNSMMVLRTIDTIPVSAAPSLVDAISTDDVTSSSCSIETSPVPRDYYSTLKGRRRCLPSLPTQETRQGINGTGLNAGGKVSGLQRKHSLVWPSSSGAANHRLGDGVDHLRSIDIVDHNRLSDGVNHHRLSDGVNHHRSIDGVDHLRSIDGVNYLLLSDGVNHHRSIDGVNLHRLSDGVNHHRLSGGVNHHRSIDGVNLHRLSDGVNHHRLSGGVNHRGNEVLGDCFNNGVSGRHPSEGTNTSGITVDRHCSDRVNDCTDDPVKHHPSATVTQTSSVASKRHINGAASHCPGNGVHHQSRSVDQSPSNNHNLPKNLDPVQNDNDGHHKSELFIRLRGQSGVKLDDLGTNHLQGQSGITLRDIDTPISHPQGRGRPELKDKSISGPLQGQSGIKLKDTGINHIQEQSDITLNERTINNCESEMKTCNTSRCNPHPHSHNINNHFEGLAVNLNASKDEVIRRGHANDCQNEVVDKSQCIVGYNTNGISNNHRNDRESAFQTARAKSHDNGVQSNNQQEVLGVYRKKKLNPRNTDGGIHSLCDKMNHCPQKESVPSFSVDSVVQKQKYHHQKLHSSTSLDENVSSGERGFQYFDGAPQRKTSLDSKYGAQSKAPTSSDIEQMEVAVEDTDLAFLHTSTNPEHSTTARLCVGLPTLHTLLQTYRMTPVSLTRSDYSGVKLTSVPFMADTITSRRPAMLAPKGRRATKLGSPDGAFRPVAAVETSSGRDVQPQVVVVAGVDDGSAAAAGGSIEEGDILLEVNGTYVLGSTLDAVERLLTVNQQHLHLVLAKPIGTARPKPVNGWLSKNDNVNGTTVKQHPRDEVPAVGLVSGQRYLTLDDVYLDNRRQKTIAVRPTTLTRSSKWSSESAYTLRPIKADSAITNTMGGLSEPDEAYYPSSDSCDEVPDSDYRWQKISAV